MNCSRCSSSQNFVLDSRPAIYNTVRRRRECTDCGHRWSTSESNVLLHQIPVDGLKLRKIKELVDDITNPARQS